MEALTASRSDTESMVLELFDDAIEQPSNTTTGPSSLSMAPPQEENLCPSQLDLGAGESRGHGCSTMAGFIWNIADDVVEACQCLRN
jgi:hypothetical protein